MSKGSLPGWFPRALLSAVPIILLSSLLLGGKALFWGTPLLQFVPWRAYAWELVSRGELPLWNDLLGMGAPLLANYQSALLYPPTWLLIGLQAWGGTAWAAWGQAIFVGLHLAWCGWGMAEIGYWLGWKPFTRTFSALALALSGYLVARAGFLSITATAAWLPWVLWAGGKLADSQKREARWQAGIFLAATIGLLLLAGHAQTAWYVLLLLAAWYALWLRVESGDAESRLRKAWRWLWGWRWLGLGGLLGVLLAAAQLLPTAEYLAQSQRSAAVDFELAATYSFWPWRLLELLAPGLFGSPAAGTYWGYGNYWEDASYIGLVPLLLALKGARLAWGRGDGASGGGWKMATTLQVASQPRHDIQAVMALQARPGKRLARWCLGVMVVCLVWGLGRNTPVYPWLYQNVPTFDMFQAPTRVMIAFVFSLALLAGLGVESWQRPSGRWLYWTRLGTAGMGAVTLATGLAWMYLDVEATFLRPTAVAGLLGLVTGVLTLCAPAAESPQRYTQIWSLLAIGMTAIDLLAHGSGLNPGIEMGYYQRASTLAASPGEELAEQLGEGRLYLPGEYEEELKFDRFFLFQSFEPAGQWDELLRVRLPNMPVLEGLASANNFDPLVPGRYARWMAALPEQAPEIQSRWLNLMGVQVVESMDNRQAASVRFNRRNVEAARMRWVPCSRSAVNDVAAWTYLSDPVWDPALEVILERPASLAREQTSETCTAVGRTGDIKIFETNAMEIQMEVSADTAGWLVLADSWYPGWKAWVDGELVDIHRADYLFRAVAVPAGEHRVRFAYQPMSFWLGMLGSTAGWAGLSAAVWKIMRGKRRVA